MESDQSSQVEAEDREDIHGKSSLKTSCFMATKDDSDTCKQLGSGSQEEATGGINFFPQLYIQRYSLAVTFLMEQNITSVIDLGCSECGFMQLLSTVPSLEKIALVDIDRELLESKKRAIQPELRHHVFRRSKPLHVSLFAGRAEDIDSRLVNYEAVTLIEVVEHLYPSVLENVVHNVFGRLTPKLCVVTTPNSEFNVLFDNDDPRQFRHWDHKFEWTRQEFGQWCDNICVRYGYSVQYTGVGTLSSRPDTDHLGPCSQAAVFRLQGDGRILQSCHLGSRCYELIAESDFPYERDVALLEDKIDLEVSYCLRQMVASQKDVLTTGQPTMVAVSKLANLYTVRILCEESGVRDSLKRSGHKFSSDGLFVIKDEDGDGDEDCSDGDGDEDGERIHVKSDLMLEVWDPEWEAATGQHPDGNTVGCPPYGKDTVSEENWDTECG